jgi:hypothetical protein
MGYRNRHADTAPFAAQWDYEVLRLAYGPAVALSLLQNQPDYSNPRLVNVEADSLHLIKRNGLD